MLLGLQNITVKTKASKARLKQGTTIRLHFLFIIPIVINRLVIFENSKLKENKQSIFFGHARIRNFSPIEGNIFEHENNHINTNEIPDHFTKFLSVANGAIYYVATERVIFSRRRYNIFA